MHNNNLAYSGLNSELNSAGLQQLFTWQKQDNFYSVQLICDLFGNYEVLIRTSIKNGFIIEQSKKKLKRFDSEAMALKFIARLKVKLTRLGYHQVFI